MVCQRPGRLEVDHIQPWHRGGSHDLENLQTLCRGCHIEKTRRENRSEKWREWDSYLEEYEDA